MIDRSIRKLDKLSDTGSSMRVIDLVKINKLHGHTEAYRNQPLFSSRILNQSIIIKHRLRANETDLFESPRTLATKLVIPIDRNDLRSGGQYLFLGQKSEQAAIDMVMNDQSVSGARDRRTLAILDSLPSFDPFLVREHLRRDGVIPAPCYFEISNADSIRMLSFVRSEVEPLSQRSLGRSPRKSALGTGPDSTADLAQKLMANDLLDEMEPLRVALQMEPRQFADGVFAWRGMLYYKWVCSELREQLPDVISEIRTLRPYGFCDHQTLEGLNTARRGIAEAANRSLQRSLDILHIYDRAFSGLTDRNKPLEFRDFLIEAPQLFSELGEMLSVLHHVVSFWNYRTANALVVRITADELCDIVADFAEGLALSCPVPFVPGAEATPRRPTARQSAA